MTWKPLDQLLKWSSMVLGFWLEARNLLRNLVAGEGFEPSTFGL